MRLSTIVVLLAVVSLPAHAQKPQIQWDETYPFDEINTFTWFMTPESSLEAANPFMHNLVVNTIEAELSQGGLTEVTSDPDVYVTYHTSSEDRVRLQSDSYGYGWGGYGGWGGYYGYGWGGGPVSTTTRVIEYEEGTLVVDIWDAETETLIWRGSVSRVFSDNVQKAERQVVKAIERMAREGRKLWERANR